MRNKIFPLIALGLSLASMVAVAEEAKKEFFGHVALIGAASSSKKAVSLGYVPNYSIRVNNNSAYRIDATAYGYGGQKTFTMDPHYAATIQNNRNPPEGYEIRIVSDSGMVIFDGFVRSLACVDVYSEGGPYYSYHVNDYCLQPY